MRKRIFVILFSIIWVTGILCGCGNGTTADIETESTATPQATAQPADTPAPTTMPEPTATPEPEAEQQIDLHPFSDILGYEDYHVTVEEGMPHIWRFYAKIDDEIQCIAEAFGFRDLPDAYSTDLDSDGIAEFIANCEYGDGARRVFIYRIHDGVVEQGYINIDGYSLETEYSMDTMGSVGSIAENYDAQENTFIITGPSIHNEEEMVTITLSFEDQESFKFIPYNP